MKWYKTTPPRDEEPFLACLSKDHFMPMSDTQKEIDGMPAVRSFTLRIVMPPEKGENHCNIGNRKLMIDVFMAWLEETKKEHITAEDEGWL